MSHTGRRGYQAPVEWQCFLGLRTRRQTSALRQQRLELVCGAASEEVSPSRHVTDFSQPRNSIITSAVRPPAVFTYYAKKLEPLDGLFAKHRPRIKNGDAVADGGRAHALFAISSRRLQERYPFQCRIELPQKRAEEAVSSTSPSHVEEK